MALEPDLLLDRRRLKRQLAFWRTTLVLGVVVGLAVIFGGPGPAASVLGGQHVARLTLSGTISEDRRTLRLLERAARDDDMRALLVMINSPGGSVAGGEAFHAAIARVRAAGKPVVAIMGGTAASAGYMVALPAHRIFARESTLTGSIGVLLQSFNAAELLESLGVRPESITSGPLKDQPSPFRPLTEEGRAALSAVVEDMQSQFVAMVAAGRDMPEAQVRAVADGRVMTGRQAMALGLLDAIGGEAEARVWLAEQHEVPRDLRVRDLDPRGTAERALSSMSDAFWGGAARLLRAEGVIPWQISLR
ncbi:signal peptide peptidase SppA [Roseococcus microcysteis]|uniref:signal peptide peptidase SppA n=1 Tax=Roseococcus microcysteis TaxID=2771361 RepID=UPI00168AF3E8|nr:signal peptide peptidase SppA [Roseococcus microcysteis]